MNDRRNLKSTTMLSPWGPTICRIEGEGGGQEGAGGGGGEGGVGAEGGGDPPTGENGGGEGDKPWWDGLPDDLKSQPGVQRHKTLADAINAGVAAEKRLGVPANQMVKLPTKPDDKEGYAAVYKALGAPDTVDGYKVDLKDATDADKAVLGDFLKDAHAAGPFPPQFLAFAAEWYKARTIAADAEAVAEANAQAEAGKQALQKEWGQAYDANSAAIGKLIKELGGEALVKELDASNLGDSPELAKMLAKIAAMRAESGPSGDGQNADVSDKPMAPGVARSMIAELEGDPVRGAALRDATHPMHKAVVAERAKLLRFANPNFAQAAS